MSEPSPGKPHPYAEIIDLFREPDSPPVPAGSVPAASALPPSRARRAVLLLPVALLALTGGAAAAVIHHHDATSAASADTADPPAAPPITAVASTSPAPDVALPARQRATTATAGREYSRALDRLSAVRAPSDLATAARRLGARTTALRAAPGPLARAEAGHLAALAALGTLGTLGTLDSSAADGLTSYARLAAAAQHASDAVTSAADGRTDVPDPSVATGNVVALTGSAVVDDLGIQVGRLAEATAAAHLTAQLRIVAAEAAALVPAADGAADAVAECSTASRATAYARALRALAALRVIDGDHLSSWASLRAPLQQSLVAAGVTDADHDVHAVDAMASAAQKKMQAWAAQSEGSVPLGGAAHAAAKAAAGFATRADALVDRYLQVLATLPQVAPGQQPSYELTARFDQAGRLFDGLNSSVSALRAPGGMTGARSALADLVARGRAAATAGEEMALSAAVCDPAKRVCVLGMMREWPGYTRAVDALGSPKAVRDTIADGVRTARATVPTAAVGSGATTGAGAAPKPAV